MRYDEEGNFKGYESDREMVHTARKWVIIGVLGLLVLSVGGWFVGVAISGPKGRGEQIKQINGANNRTFSQELFVQLLADIRAYDTQVTIQQKALDSHKAQDAEKDRLAQVVAGLETQCVSTVQQYNAEANKISHRQFKDANLPEQVDTMDPNYDCKP